MACASFTLVETAIGAVGVAWTDDGLVAVAIPERDARATRAALLRKRPDAVEAEPTDAIRPLLSKIAALLRGEDADFGDTRLDLGGVTPFERSVYEVALAIPRGKTLTYGEVAGRIGEPGAARAVGAALGRNPVPIVVPCHRVLAAGGKSGGFSAPGGAATKLRLLAIEDAAPEGQPSLFAAFEAAPNPIKGGARRPPRSGSRSTSGAA